MSFDDNDVSFIESYNHRHKKPGISTGGFIALLLLILLATVIVLYTKIEYFDNGMYLNYLSCLE